MSAFWLAATGWIIAGLLGVSAIATSIVMHLKAHPKRELCYDITYTALLNDAAQGLNAKLLVNEITVEEPYMLWVSVWSNSRADISSTVFDDHRPIEISLGTRVIYDVDKPIYSHEGQDLRVERDEDKLLIPPALIKPRQAVGVILVCSGEPKVYTNNTMVDVALMEGMPSRTASRTLRVAAEFADLLPGYNLASKVVAAFNTRNI